MNLVLLNEPFYTCKILTSVVQLYILIEPSVGVSPTVGIMGGIKPIISS